jgi:hypothetical protein
MFWSYSERLTPCSLLHISRIYYYYRTVHDISPRESHGSRGTFTDLFSAAHTHRPSFDRNPSWIPIPPPDPSRSREAERKKGEREKGERRKGEAWRGHAVPYRTWSPRCPFLPRHWPSSSSPLRFPPPLLVSAAVMVEVRMGMAPLEKGGLFSVTADDCPPCCRFPIRTAPITLTRSMGRCLAPQPYSRSSTGIHPVLYCNFPPIACAGKATLG